MALVCLQPAATIHIWLFVSSSHSRQYRYSYCWLRAPESFPCSQPCEITCHFITSYYTGTPSNLFVRFCTRMGWHSRTKSDFVVTPWTTVRSASMLMSSLLYGQLYGGLYNCQLSLHDSRLLSFFTLPVFVHCIYQTSFTDSLDLSVVQSFVSEKLILYPFCKSYSEWFCLSTFQWTPFHYVIASQDSLRYINNFPKGCECGRIVLSIFLSYILDILHLIPIVVYFHFGIDNIVKCESLFERSILLIKTIVTLQWVYYVGYLCKMSFTWLILYVFFHRGTNV